MLELRRIEEKSPCVQILEYLRVCILYEHSGKWSLLSEVTLAIYKLYKWKIIVSSDICIVLTKCWCDMNNTCTICHSYISVTCNEVTLLVLLLTYRLYALIEWLILLVLKILTNICLKNLVCRNCCLIVCCFLCKTAENLVCKRLCKIICVAVCCLNLHVCLIWIYTECYV